MSTTKERAIKLNCKSSEMKTKIENLDMATGSINEILDSLNDDFLANGKPIQFHMLSNDELMGIPEFYKPAKSSIASRYFGNPKNKYRTGLHILKGIGSKAKVEKVEKAEFDKANSTAKVDLTKDKIIVGVTDKDLQLNPKVITFMKSASRKFTKDVVHKQLNSWREQSKKLSIVGGKSSGVPRKNKDLVLYLTDLVTQAKKRTTKEYENDDTLNYSQKPELIKCLNTLNSIALKLK